MKAWGELPVANRRWLIVNALIVTAVINVVLNWLIALGTVGGRDTVPMWGAPLVEPSVFWDLVGTLFLLPLFTCVLVTTAIRRDIRRGALPPLGRLPAAHRRLEELPAGRWRRGALFGALTLAVLALPLLLVLAVAGFPDLSKTQFVAWHTGFAVVLGMLVTPPIAVSAMAESRPGGPRHGELARHGDDG